ncbi:hypothetical protein GUJ93_ZPchr0003g16948 [Zizania palustris]|uniref:Uncharacterized protein n=1 Tax=Zizania palustris TaxID=103762 RepID=A0A8J5VD65_ZIZPA|nr:hypothetical protein GUJ93_ZPchr0003g16948 [Zizania palustris]
MGGSGDQTVVAGDWRVVLVRCIEEHRSVKDRKMRRRALSYTTIDVLLYQRTIEGVLLKCLNTGEAKIYMGVVHEGMCCTHQSTYKMCWMLKSVGMYWSTMLQDCFKYYKC